MKRLMVLGAVTGLLLSAMSAAAEGDLFLYNWTDYTSPELIEKFERETGVNVTLDTTTPTRPCLPS